MREITSGNPNSTIIVKDGPGEYAIISSTRSSTSYAIIKFQKGPVKDHGVNGCHQEDLLEIVIDRLKLFQDGPFPCRENALALTKCQEALHWLNSRTADRVKRGVEGRTNA